MVLAEQAVVQAVNSTEPLYVTVTNGVAGPVQMLRIVFIVPKGDDHLLLQNPTMIAQTTVSINVEITLTNLQTI